ncbi:MAG: thiamine-monophosphate kinase [Planctomycetota bacterium]|nr:MAG: thiamine-monophosphate kinase [Planctomycetota bacterium]
MEQQLIRWLEERLGPGPKVPLALGDDAAVLQHSGSRSVVTVDLLNDGVDFVLPDDPPQRVGRKALAVNLSDLAAMAARPLAGVVALALPRQGAFELAQGLYEGMLPLAAEYDLVIAGGDTNTWDGPLAISVTLIGEVTDAGPLLRSGARSGDAILVTGRFGGSRLGHQFDFDPRVEEALWLITRYPLRAGIDTSDGLSLDLARVCRASQCGAELDKAAIPIADAAYAWAEQLGDGSTALDHALGDGEDFELILAVPPEAADALIDEQPLACGLTRIGRFVSEPGLWLLDENGSRTPLDPHGYEH